MKGLKKHLSKKFQNSRLKRDYYLQFENGFLGENNFGQILSFNSSAWLKIRTITKQSISHGTEEEKKFLYIFCKSPLEKLENFILFFFSRCKAGQPSSCTI